MGPYRNETPPEAFLAVGLALRLKNKIGNESIRYVAKKANLGPQTILNILNGKTWPDLLTIARLEHALEAKLWGNEHRKQPTWLPGNYYMPPGFKRPPLAELLSAIATIDPGLAAALVHRPAHMKRGQNGVMSTTRPVPDTTDPYPLRPRVTCNRSISFGRKQNPTRKTTAR